MQEHKIAVITVHGVGDHQCGAMARQVASQLQLTNPQKYPLFQASTLAIPVDADQLYPGPAEPPIEERKKTGLPRGAESRLQTRFAAGDELQSVDMQFTATLLAGGEDYKADYVMEHLDASSKAGDVRTDVHLYEMFWADLSHGGIKNNFSIFKALMQLLLHMASLGRTALSSLLSTLPPGTAEYRRIRSLYNASAFGYWLLSMPILIGNMAFVIIGCMLLPLLIPDLQRLAAVVVASALWGIVAAYLGYILVRRHLQSEKLSSWILSYGIFTALALGFATAAAMAYLLQDSPIAYPKFLLFLIVGIIAITLGTLLMQEYETGRPGALLLWRQTGIASAIWGIVCLGLIWHEGTISTLQWLGYFAEGFFAALVVAWGVLYLTNFILFVRALWIRRLLHNDARGARNTIDTSLVSASIPTPIFISIILILWALYAQALSKISQTYFYKPLFGHFLPKKNLPSDVAAMIKLLIDLSAGQAFWPYAACITIASICAIYGLAPSIGTEIFPRKSHTAPGPSRGLGNWLDGGFSMLGAAAVIALAGFFFVLPFGVAQSYFSKNDDSHFIGIGFVGTVIAIVALSRLVTGSSHGGFSSFLSRIRVVVDTALDVDNWLRERPIGQTPRLTIMARYSSLLHHLSGQGYDRIVIVAHSQGSVITADLFRHLKNKNPELLHRLKGVRFFTLGCPLRQLYARRFPALYAWANNPQADACGFAEWVNAYGSGDYVGRFLWDDGSELSPWTPGPRSENAQMEFCVGALAHTHYFDGYAPEVIKKLDGFLV